jgi:hypothetical protein
MSFGAMLVRAFERVRWQTTQMRNILAALPQNEKIREKVRERAKGSSLGNIPVEDHGLTTRWTSTTMSCVWASRFSEEEKTVCGCVGWRTTSGS